MPVPFRYKVMGFNPMGLHPRRRVPHPHDVNKTPGAAIADASRSMPFGA